MRISAPLNSDPIPALQWIEVSSTLQLPGFEIIGLPGPEVAEARERIRAAVLASKLAFPRKRVVVNLSPANVRKRGTGLDLAMALAVVSSAGIPSPGRGGRRPRPARTWCAWGELGLDGSIKPVGQLTRAI